MDVAACLLPAATVADRPPIVGNGAQLYRYDVMWLGISCGGGSGAVRLI